MRNNLFNITSASLLVMLTAGCSSTDVAVPTCGTISAYLPTDRANNIYPAVITHLDGKPVISMPNFVVPPGKHTLTMAALIDSPKLKVKLAARTEKTLEVNVVAEQQYHVAAQFNTDKVYYGMDSHYWQPVIWQQDELQCKPITTPY